MKKSLLLIAFLSVIHSGWAQIPNPGFESVTSGKPNGWNMGAYSVFPIRDTSVANGGTHAAAIYGSVPPAYNGAVVQDFPNVSSLPVALTGFFRFYPDQGDSLIIYVELWKQGNYAGKSVTTMSIAGTSTISVFTQFSVNINYSTYTATTTDSAFISIYPTGNVSAFGYNWAHPNTKIIIDDLAWSGTTTAVSKSEKNSAVLESAYPIPACDNASIVYSVNQNSTISITLFDMMGKEVLRVLDNVQQAPGKYKAAADLHELSPGVYFYELKSSDGIRTTKKLIKQ